MRTLNTHVHVHDDLGKTHIFGPGDEVPGWAAKKITNPDVWADDTAAEASEHGEQAGSQAITHPGEPPRGGQGSGLAAWATYATDLGIPITEGMTRDDIIAAVDAHRAAQSETDGDEGDED